MRPYFNGSLPSITAVVDALSKFSYEAPGNRGMTEHKEPRYIVSVAVHPYALNHPYGIHPTANTDQLCASTYTSISLSRSLPLERMVCDHWNFDQTVPINRWLSKASWGRPNVLRFVSESPVVYISFYALSIIASRGFFARTWLHAS